MVQIDNIRQVINEIFRSYLDVVRRFTAEDFLASSMDPFRFSFNVELFGLREAIRKELEHKIEMKLEDLFGDFHEKYLGNARHIPTGTSWRVLKRGEMKGIDIANDKNEWYLQIKNKHNSLNSSSAQRLASELKRVSEERPKAVVGAGWVIAGAHRSCIGENYIRPVAKILKGNDLYEFVTGDPDGMRSALDSFGEFVVEVGNKYDFPKMIQEATDRVAKGLESRASMGYKSVVDYLYQQATR